MHSFMDFAGVLNGIMAVKTILTPRKAMIPYWLTSKNSNTPATMSRNL